MILAIIFLITDLFMVGIAYAVYGRTAVAGYSDGMVLGVHIRREKQEDPVLVEFMKNYKKDVRKVYLGLGISGVVICGLCFWYTSIFMCVWCVWFLCYIVGAVGVMFRNHRKLYDLKIQYRWGMLGEDTEENIAGTSYRCGHHSRRRYDCRLGIALRHGRSDRVCREGTEDVGFGCLSFFCGNGQRTWCIRYL